MAEQSIDWIQVQVQFATHPQAIRPLRNVRPIMTQTRPQPTSDFVTVVLSTLTVRCVAWRIDNCFNIQSSSDLLRTTPISFCSRFSFCASLS